MFATTHALASMGLREVPRPHQLFERLALILVLSATHVRPPRDPHRIRSNEQESHDPGG